MMPPTPTMTTSLLDETYVRGLMARIERTQAVFARHERAEADKGYPVFSARLRRNILGYLVVRAFDEARDDPTARDECLVVLAHLTALVAVGDHSTLH